MDTWCPGSQAFSLVHMVELLAPARNADQAVLAFRCGADAVYMGAARFGARQSAGNDLEAFQRVTREARLWNGKVYATLNTVLFDDELEAARRLAWDLHDAGVDALIIQDMAWMTMDLPPLPLHASTQAVCDTPAKVAFLGNIGISRAILARELSLDEIRAIRDATAIELEAFVFGALCVGESGRCYLSGAICGRSGNRGACAQPCRSLWTLKDAQGRTLVRNQPLLSIQDLDLSDHLEALADAGISSFKIEGRLKDGDYVKNIVSHLRGKLDGLLDRRPDLGRASLGRVQPGFIPDPSKTFNRGLQPYRLDGQRRPLGTRHASGHLGEFVGTVKRLQADRLLLEGAPELHPGDGLAFVTASGDVGGTTINGVEGHHIFVQDPSHLKVGMKVYRNLDHAYLKQMRAAKTERRMPVSATLTFGADTVHLSLADETGCTGTAEMTGVFEAPHAPAGALAHIRDALARLGDTPFLLEKLEVPEVRFVPVSRLNALRREAAKALEAARRAPRPRPQQPAAPHLPQRVPTQTLDATWNITNAAARAFYEHHGAQVREGAPETGTPMLGRVVMTTRHCLRFELGWCEHYPNPAPWARCPETDGALFLENGPTRLRCTFDCVKCCMELRLEP